MKNILGILAFVVALGIPAMAQGTRMSPDETRIGLTATTAAGYKTSKPTIATTCLAWNNVCKI